MLKSMTGYGKFEANKNSKDIIVEIKSVNHRYFEYSTRLPRSYSYMDEKLKPLIASYVSRGKVEATILITDTKDNTSKIEIDNLVAQQYIKQLRDTAQQLNIKDNLSLSDLLKIPDIFIINKDCFDEEELWLDVKYVATKSLENFMSMRSVEGESIYKDIHQRTINLKNMIDDIKMKSPQTVKLYKERIYNKINEVISSIDIDEQRVLTEVSLLADKISVTEETVRIDIHLEQLSRLLLCDEPVGRKLDFLLQEINREVNTIGSKCQDVEVSSIVIDMKSELEKIKEQIQNVE